MQIKSFQWQSLRSWLIGVAAFFALYSILGFWLVPFIAKKQLPRFAETTLERKATIADLSFNPYTLYLVARDVQLNDTDGKSLLAIGELAVQLQWKSIVRRAWTVGEIRITAPKLRLAIASDGKFNIAELLATVNKHPKEKSDVLPRLIVERLALAQGKVEVSDRRAGYEDSFFPIDFALNNFSTLPDRTGTTTLSADSTNSGTLRWKGEASVNPIRGSGELILENASLPELDGYLKSVTRAKIVSGKLSANLPYRFSYDNGKLDATLAGARLALRGLVLAQSTVQTRSGGDRDKAKLTSFASLANFDIDGLSASFATHEATVEKLSARNGRIAVRRDASGTIDLASLMIKPADEQSGTRAEANGKLNVDAAKVDATKSNVARPDEGQVQTGKAAPWKVNLKQIAFEKLAVEALDETVVPPLKISAADLQLHLKLTAQQSAQSMQVQVSDAAFSLADLALTNGLQPPIKLARLGFSDGTVDLAAQRLNLGRLYAQGAQLDLKRDSKGRLDILDRLPKTGNVSTATANKESTSPPSAAAKDTWNITAKVVELSKFGATFDDQPTGIKIHVADLAARIDDASNDLTKALKFTAGLTLQEGGRLDVQGNAMPSTGQMQAELKIGELALAPLQPLLSQHVRLKIASGNVSAKGQLNIDPGDESNDTQSGRKGPRRSKAAGLRYVGSFEVANLALNEEGGKQFASWKSVAADTLTATTSPNLLEIPMLRLVEPNATLIIENDRTFNAARLLVKAPAAEPNTAKNAATNAAPATVTPTATATVANKAQEASASIAPVAATTPASGDDTFPIRIQQLRFQKAKLDFTDLSLRPQFGAKIYDLNGIVSGLSSDHASRSQIQLEGRVDEYGLARIRGRFNPFAPRNNTDVNVVFKNVNMVSASPYTMKFAGYKIAEGKISLDLQYKIRDSQLEGTNQIVIDNLTLGERVDSPDALKLPLELAIAILKDSNGRIDLGLPVSGNMNDPQFSYGALVWKAISNLLTRVVTAPFRALGNLFGISPEKLEAIDFDAGSDRLLPPEREKLKQIAEVLTKRAQLKLSVPATYSEAADGNALKKRAVRTEIAQRAGLKLENDEQAGPLDIGQRSVRGAIRELYAERFGKDELDNQKKAAEGTAVSSNPSTSANADSPSPQEKLPIWQRAGKLIQGEPQVADATAFYRKLRDKLEENQPLAADTLSGLGSRRADAIIETLRADGVEPSRVVRGNAEKVDAEKSRPVQLKLGLASK